jgi:hypothetical protein
VTEEIQKQVSRDLWAAGQALKVEDFQAVQRHATDAALRAAVLAPQLPINQMPKDYRLDTSRTEKSMKAVPTPALSTSGAA